MIGFRRALALAIAFTVTGANSVATAQTLIVTGAPPESAVELALNATTIGSATADAAGTATLALNLSENRGRTETDARLFVDTCSDLSRVAFVELAMQPPPPRQGCARRELVGLFLVREVTTFVVRLGGAVPTVRVRQGPAPVAWLQPGSAELPSDRASSAAITGLILSGGGGWAMFGDPNAAACGTVTDCSGRESPLTYTAGAAYWIGPYVAAEASYVKPGNVTAQGAGTGFRFDTALETNVVTLVGKIGAPVGPARIYGLVGATHHWATSTTTETIADLTVAVDDATETVRGGTQVFTLNTKGWSWLYGGGVEVWATPRFAIYGEVARARLEGANADGGEGAMDEGVTLILAGARVRVF